MITTAEYQQRRVTLMQSVTKNSIILLPAAHLQHRTKSSEYPYRQCSNFYYLTGFNEPDAVLVLMPGESKPVLLFCQPKNPEKERWQGLVLGPDAAIETLGVDRAQPITALDEQLPALLKGKTIYSIQHPDFIAKLRTWIGDASIEPIEPVIGQMRLFKSPAEIQLIQKAVDITVRGHKRGMQSCKPEQYEYQLAAEYEYVFMHAGAECPAYESIVGGGKNACILHYRDNREKLKDQTLVLVDAAAEYHNYASDITRTYPVNGRFSSQQRDLYEVVLHAQMRAIDEMKPGANWDILQNTCVRVLSEGLIDLGILTAKLDEVIEKKLYRAFYMHSSGHWLGLDVHDVGAYKKDDQPIPFAPNMVMTIEPGLYIEESETVDPVWWGMGIRIEDDVLITDKGCEVMSKNCPKSVIQVEAMMGG